MSLSKDLSELVNSDVITPETADRIQDYYEGKKGNSTNRLFIVFGVIGALLIGLGIISIIAHNWDELSRITKTFFAFFPLVTGQLLCGYVLFKKPDSTAWRESSAIFLFFAVGACISLISIQYSGKSGTIPAHVDAFVPAADLYHEIICRFTIVHCRHHLLCRGNGLLVISKF